MQNKEVYVECNGNSLKMYLEQGYEMVTHWTESYTYNSNANGHFMGNEIQLNIPVQQTNTKFLLKLSDAARVLYTKPDVKELLK